MKSTCWKNSLILSLGLGMISISHASESPSTHATPLTINSDSKTVQTFTTTLKSESRLSQESVSKTTPLSKRQRSLLRLIAGVQLSGKSTQLKLMGN